MACFGMLSSGSVQAGILEINEYQYMHKALGDCQDATMHLRKRFNAALHSAQYILGSSIFATSQTWSSVPTTTISSPGTAVMTLERVHGPWARNNVCTMTDDIDAA